MSSLLEGFEEMRLVRVGPSLRERLERRIAAAHHKSMVTRLRRFREGLQREMSPEPWTALEAPMVSLLADVCDALGLDEKERVSILGSEGVLALAEILETRPVPCSHALLNERQVKAMARVRERGRISLSDYKRLCPFWSDETLRLDLADLVAQGLLTRNGVTRGTYYTPAA